MTTPLHAHGFSLRKRALVRAFTGRRDVRFVRRGQDVPPGAQLLLWGAAPLPSGLPEGVRIVRVEDGFLRSVGLGADLVRPLSWVLDDQGIYFDARRPSALEQLLQHASFEATELQRAAALRARIVQAGLTKYNLAAAPWQPRAHGRPLVLVAGQVETDASIACGSVDIATNLGLLQAVRQARPDAHIVYKPHPDVAAGLRGAGQGEQEAHRFCDEVLREAALPELLRQVDEVHVLTSLTGFEALLRGKRVTCWGQPFYAGWGLTEDRHPHPRRSRRLALDELVAGALLRYPVYLGRSNGARCTPEQALDELLQWRARQPATARWRRWLRPLLARP
ncbi:beta-3-deoxy-D-manno-oct-2-ulosonic acid transferase [Ramlibacter sp. G-1-2-2]|uniref:Beta-3-deoxy-D-manno-oct-2-ulosonic acid transferase n=1 Tax=Ramlibacter agri TaxID=2728837 RepID=A0A848H6N8_9BURK|nr:beta-3-deoxy-D-manno-oct-2-ulosonic acid transferase [Ramlibacter agri]NML45532.1 beta-3-deoxy-D-manno-oct-2-ulosonic acid transferase [Ramlibacter agri]